ncbi:MAG: ABC transporter ATP-binding protein [Nakamurella sp.]
MTSTRSAGDQPSEGRQAAVTNEGSSPLLSGRDLVLDFGATPALRGADLVVMPGEIVAVMGASGSGKSTLLHVLAGIIPPDSGTVTYRGTDVTMMHERERSALRRNAFGFIFQFGQLLPELTCVQNVALPLRLGGIGRKAAERVALEELARLDVVDTADVVPGRVSGGQAQRVAVARALIARPSIIFADEPTGALDSLQTEKVMDLLAKAVRDTQFAMVLVTHEPRVAAYSDREILMRDGRTSETRDPA